MSKNGAVGTREETRVVNWLQAHGWGDARRIEKHGSKDNGDVLWTSRVIVEVKHRRTSTSNAGLGQPGTAELAGWMAELEAERKNADADFGWLIVKRSGTTDVGQWWAYIRLRDLVGLSESALVDVGSAPVCMTVATAEVLMALNYRKAKTYGASVPPALPELREPAA